jgi:D-amino-acid dehydrogenase
MAVVVVGAGVVGLACAWELACSGAEVVVVDGDSVGAGVSRGNAGWITPTISSPLPAPGIAREGLHQLVTGGDAFVLRPRVDLTLLRWLWTFWRSCSGPRFEAGTNALMKLNRRTMELYDRYRDAGIAFEMHATGLVIAALTEDGMEPYRRLASLLQRLGYEGRVDELEGSEAARIEPALDAATVVRALHARDDRYVRPEELVDGLAQALRDMGVDIREGWFITSLQRRNGGWVLQANQSDIRAEKVVVAAGLGSPRLLREHGVRMPLVGARGYSITVTGTGVPPRHALYLAEAKLGLSPFTSGVRVAGVLELGARDAAAPAGTGAKLLSAAAPYLDGWKPEPRTEPVAWAGLRPVTADGLPLIGAVRGREGLYVAAGHAMLGVTLAPATAAALAPLVLRGEHVPELVPFDPRRHRR